MNRELSPESAGLQSFVVLLFGPVMFLFGFPSIRQTAVVRKTVSSVSVCTAFSVPNNIKQNKLPAGRAFKTCFPWELVETKNRGKTGQPPLQPSTNLSLKAASNSFQPVMCLALRRGICGVTQLQVYCPDWWSWSSARVILVFLVTSLTKALLPQLFSLARWPVLGRVLSDPNLFHVKGHFAHRSNFFVALSRSVSLYHSVSEL